MYIYIYIYTLDVQMGAKAPICTRSCRSQSMGSCSQPRTSELKPSLPEPKPRISELKPSFSELTPRISERKPRTSELKPNTSDQQADDFDIKFGSFRYPICVILVAFGGHFCDPGASWSASWLLGDLRSRPGPSQERLGEPPGPSRSALVANLAST